MSAEMKPEQHHSPSPRPKTTRETKARVEGSRPLLTENPLHARLSMRNIHTTHACRGWVDKRRPREARLLLRW